MSDRDLTYLARLMAPMIGDIRARGYETRRVAFEQAVKDTNNNVMHLGSPTGHEDEHGAREVYAGTVNFSSNQHQRNVIDRIRELEKNSQPALHALARQRGYYGSHPPSDQRFEYVEGYREQIMESFNADGETVAVPVYGRGRVQESPYLNQPAADPDGPIIYGDPKKIRGTDQRSRYADVGSAPTLPNGEIDYDTINRMNGHTTMSGRRNITGKIT